MRSLAEQLSRAALLANINSRSESTHNLTVTIELGEHGFMLVMNSKGKITRDIRQWKYTVAYEDMQAGRVDKVLDLAIKTGLKKLGYDFITSLDDPAAPIPF